MFTAYREKTGSFAAIQELSGKAKTAVLSRAEKEVENMRKCAYI
jgi:hypothetical protein